MHGLQLRGSGGEVLKENSQKIILQTLMTMTFLHMSSMITLQNKHGMSLRSLEIHPNLRLVGIIVTRRFEIIYNRKLFE
jgi:hypothetical protein